MTITLPTWVYALITIILLAYAVGLAMQAYFTFAKRYADQRLNDSSFMRILRLLAYPVYMLIYTESANRAALANPAVRLQLSKDLATCYVYLSDGTVFVLTENLVKYDNPHGASFVPLRSNAVATNCYFTLAGVIMTPTSHTGVGQTSLTTNKQLNRRTYAADALLMPEGDGALILQSDGRVLSFGHAPQFAALPESPLFGAINVSWVLPRPNEFTRPMSLRQLYRSTTEPARSGDLARS